MKHVVLIIDKEEFRELQELESLRLDGINDAYIKTVDNDLLHFVKGEKDEDDII